MFGLSPDSKPSMRERYAEHSRIMESASCSCSLQLSIAAGRSEVHVLSAQDRGLQWNHWYTYLIHQGSFTSAEL